MLVFTPKLTRVSSPKPDPMMEIVAPPERSPSAGVTAVMRGSASGTRVKTVSAKGPAGDVIRRK